MRNRQTPGNTTLIREGIRALRNRLPPGWTVSEPIAAYTSAQADAIVTVSTPGHRLEGPLVLEARSRLEPRDVGALLEGTSSRLRGTLVVLAPYLSEGTRARLREAEVAYLDLSGNARISVPEPGLYIEAQGASEDPNRQERPARSLRGAKAGRIVRALVDHEKPPGVRELAAATTVNPGYVSRVLKLLDSEALITRTGRGQIQSVDWPALLRRWAQDAPLSSRGVTQTCLEPRGLSSFVDRLGSSGERYAVTGGLAASVLAPAAPVRLAVVWMRDAAAAGERLGLRPADAGANVLLIEPDGDDVFVGASARKGVWYAAPSQVAADLLTSPGRGPAEGEELIGWMQANEGAWRR